MYNYLYYPLGDIDYIYTSKQKSPVTKDASTQTDNEMYPVIHNIPFFSSLFFSHIYNQSKPELSSKPETRSKETIRNE